MKNAKEKREHNEEQDTHFGEIEYTPIRRRGAENGSGMVLSSDEISVVTPARPRSKKKRTPEVEFFSPDVSTDAGATDNGTTDETALDKNTTDEVPAQEVGAFAVVTDENSEETDTARDDVEEDFSAREESSVTETTSDLHQTREDVTQTESEENPERSSMEDVTPSVFHPEYERVILPDEISLVGVLPLPDAHEVEQIREEDNAPKDAHQLSPEEDTPPTDEDEEFVFTPMPRPVEYERIVLPDEISLADVLSEIRPNAVLSEEQEEITIVPDATETVTEPAIEDEVPLEETVDAEAEDIIMVADEECATLDENTDTAPEADTENEGEQTEETGESFIHSPEGVDRSEDTVWTLPYSDFIGEEDTPVVLSESAPETTPEEIIFAPEEYATLDTETESVPLDTGAEELPITESEVPHMNEESPDELPVFVDAPKSDTPKKKEKEKEEERPIEGRFDIVELFAFTLAFVLILTTFFFRSSAVVGGSMNNTLSDGDQLILYSFMYEPEVGDIIVFEDYTTPYREALVKRVIATEGQTVTILDSYTVYVDNVKLPDEYVCVDGVDKTEYPIVHTVAEGHIYVMGDHRNASSDSRLFGDVAVESVLGRVLFRYYPFEDFKKFD